LQRLRLHLDQREPDVVLDIDFGALGSVEDVPVPGSVASNVANSALNVLRELRAATLENRPEAIKAACLCYRRRISLEHGRLPVLLLTCPRGIGSERSDPRVHAVPRGNQVAMWEASRRRLQLSTSRAVIAQHIGSGGGVQHKTRFKMKRGPRNL